MSWSVSMVGKPEAVRRYLAEAAKTYGDPVTSQSLGRRPRARCRHASFDAAGVKTQGHCSVALHLRLGAAHLHADSQYGFVEVGS